MQTNIYIHTRDEKKNTEIEYNKTAVVTYHMNEKRKREEEEEGKEKDPHLFHT